MQPSQLPTLQIVQDLPAPSSRLAVFADTLGLDIGEMAALSLMESHHLRMFMSDDSAARLAGEALGLKVHGTIGILVRAIRRGLRSQADILHILEHIRERSTLHLADSLLVDVVASVRKG